MPAGYGYVAGQWGPHAVMAMYTPLMRRIQIYIEEQLAERLGSEAARAGVS